MEAASQRSRFLPLMAALTATAWLALWLWGQSPYGRYLDHGSWAEIGVAGSLCRALPGGWDVLTGSLVVGGWVLMLSAMMLPTTLPLLDIFRRLTARRADRRMAIEPAARGLPVIYVFSQVENPDALCLLPDDQGGAKLAVNHLAALGRRRIAHITGPERFEAVRLREEGWREGLAEAGLRAVATHCRPGRWSEAWGREAAQTLFSRRRAVPDALFCGNDQIARGAVDALREMGLGVPDDVAVVGFDNWGVMAEAARPALTSIDMNLEALGREAGASLMEMMGGRTLTGVRRLPCSLVIRDSCGARGRRAERGRQS